MPGDLKIAEKKILYLIAYSRVSLSAVEIGCRSFSILSKIECWPSERMHVYRGFPTTTSCLVLSSRGNICIRSSSVQFVLLVDCYPSWYWHVLNIFTWFVCQIHASRECGCSSCCYSTWIHPWAIFSSPSFSSTRDTRTSSLLPILLDDTRPRVTDLDLGHTSLHSLCPG